MAPERAQRAKEELVSTLTDFGRAMKPQVAERCSQTDQQRYVPRETVDALKKGGFFRGFQSKRYGGLEVHPADFFGAIIEVASACPSTGWVMGIVGIHQFELAHLSLELQEEVLGRDPDTLISSSYAPQGKAEQVDGGFRLSGQWKSSSGVDHASWVVLSSYVPPLDGKGPPAQHIFYVPISEVKLLDDWDVVGLRGTGSKSVLADDIFVPAHRASSRGGFNGAGSFPATSSDAALYLLPQTLMYLLPGAAPALGAAKGAYESFLQQCHKRRPRLDGSSMLQDPLVQKRVATAKYLIDNAEMRMMQSINAMTATVQAGQEITRDEYARYLWDFSRVGEDVFIATRSVFEIMGASAIYSSNPLGRFYRDLIAMRQHGTQDPDRGALLVGAAELGLRA
jgi:3-hydroxy-9,10-secoandrosta-1,3,5(10)-triene-9,17-dione monooxygenase